MPAPIEVQSPRPQRSPDDHPTPLVQQFSYLTATFEFESDFRSLYSPSNLSSSYLGGGGAVIGSDAFFATAAASSTFSSNNNNSSSSSSSSNSTPQVRDFETAFCSDFYCCGTTLLDLHDLLQHYEECHVRFEEDNDEDEDVLGAEAASEYFEEDVWSDSDSAPSISPLSLSPPPFDLNQGDSSDRSSRSPSRSQHGAAVGSSSTRSRSVFEQQHPSYMLPSLYSRHPYFDNGNPTTHALEALSATFGGPTKRKAVVSLADLYVEDDGYGHTDMHSYEIPNPLLRSPSRAGTIPGEHWGPLAKRQAVAVTSGNPFSTVGNYSGVFPGGVVIGGDGKPIGPLSGSHRAMFQKGPTAHSATALPPTNGPAAADWMRQRDEVFSILEDMTKAPSNTSDENKPYRCSVPGCDKTYKNPNGLKYHNQHGHSSTGLGDADNPDARPYVCTFLECGKRYKNLNGLKYHIEHTHPNLIAALRAHQAGLSNHPLLVNGAYVNHQAAAMTIAAALAAVEVSPMMALAANAVLAAHATAAAAATASASSNTPTPVAVSINITPTIAVIGEATGETAAANFEVHPVALSIVS